MAEVKIQFSPRCTNATEYSSLRKVILDYSILELLDNLLYVSSLSKNVPLYNKLDFFSQRMYFYSLCKVVTTYL